MTTLFGFDLGNLFDFGISDFLEFLPEDFLSNEVISAGLLTTGTLVSGLFASDVAQEESEKNREFQERQFAAQQEELALQREERERERQLQLKLAEIDARAKAGLIRPSTEPLSNAAGRLIQGAQTEQSAISNLIQGQLGALGTGGVG